LILKSSDEYNTDVVIKITKVIFIALNFNFLAKDRIKIAREIYNNGEMKKL
jgi:hypothetical protein